MPSSSSGHLLLLHGEEHHHPPPPGLKPYPALFLGLGLLLLALGAMIPPRLHAAVHSAVFEQIRIDSPSSPNLEAFVNGSVLDDELLLRFYLFDVIKETKLQHFQVKERGPYVYAVKLKRFNLSFVDLESPRRELYYKTWQQVRPVVGGEWGGREDSELITTVSMPYQFLRAMTGVQRPLLVRKSVHEHLFGYEQSLASQIPIKFPGFVQNFSSMKEAGDNNRIDGQRVDVSQDMFTYQNFQGQSILKRCPICLEPLWRTLQANRVQGGDGRFWGKHTNSVFLPQLNRHVNVQRSPITQKVDGIEVKHFTLDSDSLFDLTAEHNSRAIRGVFNLTKAYLNVPLFASKPKFLDGNESLFTGVDGLIRPNREEHDTVFKVHEDTRLSVEVALRLQYNIHLAKPNVFLPLFWFETAEVMSHEHKRLFARCDRITSAAGWIASLCTSLGIGMIVLASVISTNRAEAKAKQQQLQAAIVEERERNDDDDNDNDKQGIALLLSSSSLRWEWITTPPFVFAINVVIELLTLRQDKHIGVWSKYGENSSQTETVWAQTLLTAFIVSLTVAVSAVQKARSAFIDGEVPRRTAKYEQFNQKWWCLPLRASGDACKLGLSLGLTSVFVLAIPMLLGIYAFACRDAECTWDWRYYILVKASLAALLAAGIYPFAALRALHQNIF
ncbi:hypothetical protein BASA81_010146 [Batrachochytrium salamandrivorans]|nr:hypothetical protein BASA81_010146 [Batrachochytrium salamandrivorans]